MRDRTQLGITPTLRVRALCAICCAENRWCSLVNVSCAHLASRYCSGGGAVWQAAPRGPALCSRPRRRSCSVACCGAPGAGPCCACRGNSIRCRCRYTTHDGARREDALRFWAVWRRSCCKQGSAACVGSVSAAVGMIRRSLLHDAGERFLPFGGGVKALLVSGHLPRGQRDSSNPWLSVT